MDSLLGACNKRRPFLHHTLVSGDRLYSMDDQTQVSFGNKSTQVAFSSVFISRRNWDPSLLDERTRVEPETTSTPDLANLATNSSALYSTERKSTQTLNLQLQQMKVPKQNPNPPSSCYYCKKPGLWEKDCHKCKCLKYLQPSNQPFQRPPDHHQRASEEPQGFFPTLPLHQLRKTTLQIGNESLLAPEPHSQFNCGKAAPASEHESDPNSGSL